MRSWMRWAGALGIALFGCGGSRMPGGLPMGAPGSVQQSQGGTVTIIPGQFTPSSPPVWIPEVPPAKSPGPWPTDAVVSFAQAHLPGLNSVGIDDGYNLWLLDDSNRIGVLRPDDATATWGSGLGQAGKGFSTTVICGGTAGQAYVGYWAAEGGDQGCGSVWHRPTDPSDGDMDVVKLDGGGISLVQHLNIFNSNDHHCDETRAILACTKVMRGPMKGDIYVGSNHAVTRIRGLDYSDHRHSVWADSTGSLHIGYDYAVSITPKGDVLFGNEWKVAELTPLPDLQSWIDFDKTPWKLDTYVWELNSLEDMDFWRATAETQDGTQYFGSLMYGLWKRTGHNDFEKVAGLPSDDIAALAGTDDGALYVGTIGGGLWRLGKDGKLAPVAEVPGGNVYQLVYDPTTQPSMLLVLTNAGLFMLRGP